MPNIELHSFTAITAQGLRDRIFTLFHDKLYEDEVVVSICPTRTFNTNLEVQPFLRLIHSCTDHVEEIIEILRTLCLDIEQLQLSTFYPAIKPEPTTEAD
jgi:hypothetical protein